MTADLVKAKTFFKKQTSNIEKNTLNLFFTKKINQHHKNYFVLFLLKGVCHEISTSIFFHDSNPSRRLINRLKYFRIGFRFCRDIRIFKKLRSAHPTAQSDSAVCCTPRSCAPGCASHCGVKLLGVHHIAESSDKKFSKNSAVCIPPQSQTPRCASYRGVKLRCASHPGANNLSVLIQSFRNAISL